MASPPRSAQIQKGSKVLVVKGNYQSTAVKTVVSITKSGKSAYVTNDGSVPQLVRITSLLLLENTVVLNSNNGNIPIDIEHGSFLTKANFIYKTFGIELAFSWPNGLHRRFRLYRRGLRT